MSLAAALVLSLALRGPDYPRQTGLVNDFAGVLDAGSKARIQSVLEGLEKSKSFVLVVVTVKSLDGRPIEEYAVGLANQWQIGQKGKNNGIVFLIAPAEKALRVENGYGAESALTDIESKLIMEETVVPRMKEGKISEGISAGTEALAAKLGAGPIQAAAPIQDTKRSLKVGLVVVLLIIVVIMMCFPAGRQILWALVQIGAAFSGDSKGSGGSKGSSGSGGGKFGGGGASSKW